MMKNFRGDVFSLFAPPPYPPQDLRVHTMEVELIELGKPARIALRRFHRKPLVSSLLAGLQPVLRSYVVSKDNGRDGEKVTG
jgi:hypothetical protein